MSVTATQALAAVKAQLATVNLAFPVYWRGDPAPILPDEPTTFAYVVFNNDGSGRGPASFGGGRGNNLYRNRANLEAYVFAPDGEGLEVAQDAAELFAASLRSFRDSYISCFAADVIPIGPGSSIAVPGLTSVVSQYQCAVAEIAMHFDQIG
jgi:hypothetical protein